MPVDRILVVDDEETIREIVSSMLTTAGYKCQNAGSGMEALALLESGEECEPMPSRLLTANLGGHGRPAREGCAGSPEAVAAWLAGAGGKSSLSTNAPDTGAVRAATSHSASVGRRRSAQRAKASAS